MCDHESFPCRYRLALNEATGIVVKRAIASVLIWNSAWVIHIRHQRGPHRLGDRGSCRENAHHHYQHRETSGGQNIASKSSHRDLPSVELPIRLLPVKNNSKTAHTVK